jgi:hypothetical protein
MPIGTITTQGRISSVLAVTAQDLWLRLYRNNLPVVDGSLLSDFFPALFPGYADIRLATHWQLPSIDGQGDAVVTTNGLVWVRAAGGVPESEYGWLVYRNPAPFSQLVTGGLFTAPIITSRPGDLITQTVVFKCLRRA